MKRILFVQSRPRALEQVHLLKVNGRVITALPARLAALLLDPYHGREFPEGFEIEVDPGAEAGTGGRIHRLGQGPEGTSGASVVPFVLKHRQAETPLDGE